MGKFLLEKLIVISEAERKSKEVNFGKGLNIIIGKNKTGKSSLLKSIFYTLGAELKLEDEWKKAIDWYTLFFSYNERSFCIIRRAKNFKILKFQKNNHTELVVDTEAFHEYSQKLMDILGVDVECLTKDEKIVSITPPLLFRFQYIDQDKGWNKIGEPFTNMAYILNWKDYSSKYVVGFQGSEFYQTKKEINLSKNKIDNLTTKLNNFEELINHLSSNTNLESVETSKAFANDLEKYKSIIKSLDDLERQKLRVQDKMSFLKNERYEKTLAIDLLKKNVQELNEDHAYAMSEEESLKCPFCGVIHNNSMAERVEIVKDIQAGSEYIGIYRNELREIEIEISDTEKENKKINYEVLMLKKLLEETKNGASIVNSFKNDGKREIINSSESEKKRLQKLIDIEEKVKGEKERLINILNSVERRNKIYTDFKEQYKKVLDKLNIPISYMGFNNFVQVLNKTGSELPRIIYAYHIALYLYNLERQEGLFNWLVVDTPNQQGQDESNLNNIDSALELVLSKEGQFIIGTERKTGFEDKATKIIHLTNYKKCLISNKYDEHKAMIKRLNDVRV